MIKRYANLIYCIYKRSRENHKCLKLKAVVLSVFLFVFLLSFKGRAEGSKDLFPQTLQGQRSVLMSSLNTTTAGWFFLQLATHYVYVKSGETLATATSAQGIGEGLIRMTAPDGTVYSSTAGDDVTGRIVNRTQELAGPNVGASTSSYTPFEHLVSSTQTGIWKVEFLPTRSAAANVSLSSAGAGNNVNANWVQSVNSHAIVAWDISVIAADAQTLINGRAYATVMNMYNSNNYYSLIKVLTNDGYVYQINNNGSAGAGFAYFVNNKGVTDTKEDNAKPLYKSFATPGSTLNVNIKDPREPDGSSTFTHKLFYNYPDPKMPANGSYAGGSTWLNVPKIVPSVSGITVTGVEGTSGQMSTKGASIKFKANMAGEYRINLTGPAPFVARQITGSAVAGDNTAFWDGKDGAGAFAPPGTSAIMVKVILQGAEVHFPFMDIETNSRGIIIEQLNDDGSKKAGADLVYWDDSDFATGSTASNPQFNGNSGSGISSNSNGHKWGTNYGNDRLMDTWTYILSDEITESTTVKVTVADLEVQGVTTTAASPVAAGSNDPVTFTVPVVNNGPSDVIRAAFKFKVPAGFTIADATTAVTYSTTCATVKNAAIDASGNYTALLDMPNGCLITFTISGKLGSGFSGTSLDAEGSIMRPADTTDPDATNPNGTAAPTDPHQECLNGTNTEKCNNIKYLSIPVISRADIVTLKSSTATGYTPGSPVNYTVVVRNDGSADAAEVTITDLAPAGTTISSWTASVTSGTVSLPASSGSGDLNQTITVFPNGAAVSYSINLAVGGGYTGDLINTARASSKTTDDPDTGNNASSVTLAAKMVAAPVSGGDQTVCSTEPIQTLTARATAAAGDTITWYSAPSGGTIVSNPVLNKVGTVVYFAEASNNGTKSGSRTAVVLKIIASPKIDPAADRSACVSYTFPAITGSNLTGNQAYYTQSGGMGTKYLAGASFDTVGTKTFYLYDKGVDERCSGNLVVTQNTDMSNNVVLHKILSISHDYYPRPVNADFWKGTANQGILYSTAERSPLYLSLVGDLNINKDAACTGNQVQITAGATFTNDGPSAGAGYSGRILIANKLTGESLYAQDFVSDSKVGVTTTYTISGLVSAQDLTDGNLVIIMAAETAQDGYKSWTVSAFNAKYTYVSNVSCPDEKSFKLTINSLPTIPVSSGNQEVCSTDPLQTLTAKATVQAGAAITWYDAATGGNLITAPTLNKIGSVTYYAEAVSNGCSSAGRVPVRLTINRSPVIYVIPDTSACGPLKLPAIAGTNLSGNAAYYTGINKTGTKYKPGEIFSTTGQTTLYAYDETATLGGANPEGALILTNITSTAGGYTNTKLQALWPDQTRAFPRIGKLSGDPAVASSFLSYAVGSAATTNFSAVVGNLALPAGYTNAGNQVLVSLDNAWIRNYNTPLQSVEGYASQVAIMNTATNQLLYQTLFNDVPGTGIRPSLAGLVSAADLIAGNIGVYIEYKTGAWRISGLTAKYQFASGDGSCPAQQSFKITVNPIPEAPTASNQTDCEHSPMQTLIATATVPSGSTVVWYDAATGGNVISSPNLHIVGTVTYYAEAHTGNCISPTRTPVVLTINPAPIVTTQNPAVVCHPGTIDLTAAKVTSGSTAGLIFTYFTDAAATLVLADPAHVAVSGTYYIKGTSTPTGCSTIAPVSVQFVDRPEVTVAHPDCVSAVGSIMITSPLEAQFEYSINGRDYQPDTFFNNLAPGTYSVTARHTALPACVSEANVVVINATPTTATPLVIQPDCNKRGGSIIFPVNAAYEYAINGGAYFAKNEFTNLGPGTYSISSKKAGEACIANPVAVIIYQSPDRPAAPIAGADQQVCESNVANTLMATATVPAGTTITWYDAETGGNAITNPTLNAVGTVIYYAEASNGTCTSLARTPVKLTITALPVIHDLADQHVCAPMTLPPITGTNLSGNEAYYTAINGEGTKYHAGDIYSTPGETTLYIYDKNNAGTNETSCAAEAGFKVFIHLTTAGEIGNDQTICSGTAPLTINSNIAGTGSGNIYYRWESSTNPLAGFSTIDGAISASFSPGILTQHTYFRRITIAEDNGLSCESSPSAVVNISLNSSPAATDASHNIAENTPVNGQIIGQDEDGDTLSYSKQTEPLNGIAVVHTDGSYLYTPNSFYHGDDSFTIGISDGKCAITTVTVYITVRPVDHPNPEAQFSKTALNGGDKVGDVIRYELIIKNTGNLVLKNLVVEDHGADAGSISPSVIAILMPGTQVSINASHTLKQEEVDKGSFSNQAILTLQRDSGVPLPPIGSDDPNTPATGDSTTVQIPESSGIALIKDAVLSTDGQSIVYNFTIKNTGNVTLNGFQLTDGKLGLNRKDIVVPGGLLPGKSASYSQVYTLTQADKDAESISNIARIDAKSPSGNNVGDGSGTDEFNDTPTVVFNNPRTAVTIIKTAQFIDNYIIYTFTIKNTGNTILTRIELTDAKLGIKGSPVKLDGGLLPAAVTTLTEKYILTQEDKDAGEVSNTAGVIASDANGTTVNDVSGTKEGNHAPTVIPVPKSPLAIDDTAVTKPGEKVMIPVLTNDNSGNSQLDESTITIVSPPLNGTVKVNEDGTVTYTPNQGYVGVDTFTYQVKDKYGYLTNIATVTITSVFKDLSIPTLFTPNGDGNNDAFEIIGLSQFAQSNLVIVNRWGNEVYKSTHYQNDWMGEGLNEGTYYYLLKVKLSDTSQWIIYKGYITLIRAFKK